MTEEIEVQAEIYAKGKHCMECSNLPTCWEDAIEDCCLTCKRTNEDFIAGAKWGIEHAIEWHDLRKDPTDLPKEKGEYRVYFYDSELKANRNVNWYYYGKSWGCRLDVIAWCELPKYKE